MKIIVTVGSSAFNQMIEAVDQQLAGQGYAVTCQIADGSYQPRHHAFFTFADDLQQRFADADMVITHGGAGTVFELLEMGKKIVVVPNLYRLDKHQQDLAQYIEAQGYGTVCHQLERLLESVRLCQNSEFEIYKKDPFFMADDLFQYFGIDKA
jgi:beta-1,4-N-acetylglucosaminyltransferase